MLRDDKKRQSPLAGLHLLPIQDKNIDLGAHIKAIEFCKRCTQLEHHWNFSRNMTTLMNEVR